MPTLQDIRKKYPEYNDMPDQTLADKFHDKFYSDIPKDQFYAKIGFKSAPNPPPKPKGYGEDQLRGIGRDIKTGFDNVVGSTAQGFKRGIDPVVADMKKAYSGAPDEKRTPFVQQGGGLPFVQPMIDQFLEKISGPGTTIGNRNPGGERAAAADRLGGEVGNVPLKTGAGFAHGVTGIDPNDAEALGVGAMMLLPKGGPARIGDELRQSPAGRALNRATGNRITSPEQSARERLQRAGVTPELLKAEIEKRRAAGSEHPTVLEAAPRRAAGIIRAAANKSGPAADLAVQHAERTQENLAPEAVRSVRRMSSEGRNPTEMVTALKDARQRAADEQYLEAYNKPIDLSPKMLSAIEGPDGDRAINEALAAARASRRMDQVRELQTLRSLREMKGIEQVSEEARPRVINGYLKQIGPMSAGSLDLVRQALSKRAERMSVSGGRPTLAPGLRSRAQDLSRELDEIEHLKDARSNYRSYSQQIDAIEMGQNFMRPSVSPAEFKKQWEKLPEEAKTTARVGMREAIRAGLSKDSGPTSMLRAIANGPDTQEKLTVALGEDMAAKMIADAKFRRIKMGRASFINPDINSKSASVLEDTGAGGVLSAAARPGSVPGKVISALGKHLSTMSDAEREALVKLAIKRAAPEDYGGGPGKKVVSRRPAPDQQ